jgi:DNA-binding PadR family transcriptional regulator
MNVGLLKNRRLKKEQKLESQLYELMENQEWWYVTDLLKDIGWWATAYIYPLLIRLEAQGVIISVWRAEATGPRRRRYRMI